MVIIFEEGRKIFCLMTGEEKVLIGVKDETDFEAKRLVIFFPLVVKLSEDKKLGRHLNPCSLLLV